MLAMENAVFERQGKPQEASSPAIRSIERALEPRSAAYLDEVQRLLQAGLDEMRERQCVEPRVAAEDQRQMVQAWRDSLIKSAGLQWERPAVEPSRR